MPKPRLIYFDFGAVLVNYEKVFTQICADFSIDLQDLWDMYNRHDADLAIGKISTAEFWQKCIDRYQLQNTADYDLLERWVTDYEVIQPVQDLVYALEGQVAVGIISNINEGPWEKSLELGLVPNIKYQRVYLSYQEKMAKPNLDIYQKVQQESGVLPEEIVFVDDKAENLVAPQSLGWQTVLFDRLQAEAGVARIKSLLAI